MPNSIEKRQAANDRQLEYAIDDLAHEIVSAVRFTSMSAHLLFPEAIIELLDTTLANSFVPEPTNAWAPP